MKNHTMRARLVSISVAGAACFGLSAIESRAQVATTPGTPAIPTPTPDLSNAPLPKGRSRSIKLPDTLDGSEKPAATDETASPAPTLPPPFTVTWRDAAKRIAVHLARDMRTQGEMFARVVLFVEMRNASKTEVISQRDLPGWFTKHKSSRDVVTAGNNLRAADLARFFNTARIQNEPLTAAEQRLLVGLIENNLLTKSGLGVEATQPERMLVTAALPSTVDGCAACTVSAETHEAILTHELGHARYFIDGVYRDFVRWFWAHGLDDAMRQSFTNLLVLRGYDESNKALLADEMQAFLMHTPSNQLFSATMLGASPEALGAVRVAFLQGLRALELPIVWQMPPSQ